MSSETQVVDVTTTIKKEIKPLEEEKVEATKHLDSTELSGTTSRSTDEGHEDKHDNDYLVGGNSEAVSITSSRLLEEYPSSHYLKERASTAQMSTVTFQMNSTSEKELLEKFGQCTKCNQPNTGEDNWCRSCNSLQFRSQFDYWSSGNENVNKIIRNAQLSARSNKYVLEWIPFNKFQDVKYVSKGGFGTVYSAYWVDGYILGWDNNLEQWQRHGTDMVALKRLYNSKFITMEFLNQIVKVHLQLHDNSNIVQYYGITQYPETDDYMIVMEYAVQGSIRSYLNGRFNTMNWYGKMNILSSITRGLEWMHESGYIHYNLHVGNILRTGTGETIITDVGIKKPTIKFTSLLRDKVEIYGVLPYLAPEVLHSKIFSKESDIYAFGVMMNEIISGLPPFNNVAHDSRLAAEICRGSRPEIPVHTPRLLAELIQRCWETKPNNRPSAKELNELLTQWWNDLQNDQLSEINAQCKSCDEMSRNSSTFTPTPLLYVSHPEAVYHSRLLEFDDMPRIINTDRRSKLLNSFPYSESRQIDGQDNLEYQDDQDDHTSSCLCPFNYLLNWLHSLKKLKK